MIAKPKLFMALCISFLLIALPVSAQDNAIVPHTITVTGIASASASPDIARIAIGVEQLNSNISEAFSQVNATKDGIIEAIVALGVACEDIRTTGLNVYLQQTPAPADQMNPQNTETNYRVANSVQVTVRDISMIEEVVNTALENGANNIFGLNFGIANPEELQREARSIAVDDARFRAEHLAALMHLQLGEVISVTELSRANPTPYIDNAAMIGAGGGATIETGQLSVSLQLQVVYEIVNSS